MDRETQPQELPEYLDSLIELLGILEDMGDRTYNAREILTDFISELEDLID